MSRNNDDKDYEDLMDHEKFDRDWRETNGDPDRQRELCEEYYGSGSDSRK